MSTVTEQDVKSKIASTTYNRIPGSTITICQLQLANGFSVIGQSACVDDAIFSEQHGEHAAFEDALSKLWVLEGYLLKEDLYRSVLPKEGKAMTFGQAIEALKKGLKVTRAGWNGKDMWLSLSSSYVKHAVHAEHFWSGNNREYAKLQPNQTAVVLPCITMKTATGEILMGWLASQTDMLAEDWVVVP